MCRHFWYMETGLIFILGSYFIGAVIALAIINAVNQSNIIEGDPRYIHPLVSFLSWILVLSALCILISTAIDMMKRK